LSRPVDPLLAEDGETFIDNPDIGVGSQQAGQIGASIALDEQHDER
jgi:hypothetical protein